MLHSKKGWKKVSVKWGRVVKYLTFSCKLRVRVFSVHSQCQLVKNFENRTNSLNIGMKCHSGINLEINGMDHTICPAVLLFYGMANKQVWKIPAMWYNDLVSQNRYVKLTGTWNLCWRAKFLSGLTGSVCFLIRPSTSGGSSPECSRRKWRQVLKAIEKSTWWLCFRFCFSNVTCPVM